MALAPEVRDLNPFEIGLAMVRIFQDEWGAQVHEYDVDPSGAVSVSLAIDGSHHRVRLLRCEERLGRIAERAQWGDQVRQHVHRVRAYLAGFAA